MVLFVRGISGADERHRCWTSHEDRLCRFSPLGLEDHLEGEGDCCLIASSPGVNGRLEQRVRRRYTEYLCLLSSFRFERTHITAVLSAVLRDAI